MGTTTPNHKDVACYYFVLFDMNNTGLWALPRMEVRRQQLRVHRKHLNQRVCLSMVVPLLGLKCFAYVKNFACSEYAETMITAVF